MRKVEIESAVGLPLGHDITEVDPHKKIKRRAFKRGHIITESDLERLRDLGKSAVFVMEEGDTSVHEDDAAKLVAPLAAGPNIQFDAEPYEGKINFRASCDGVFCIDPERLYAINSLAIPSMVTLPGNIQVVKGQTVAGFRIVPLTCEAEIMDQVTAVLTTPLLDVSPFKLKNAGIVVTGSEVFEGRIKDGFIPRLTKTLAAFGVKVASSEIVPDDRAIIAEATAKAVETCDLVMVTGGTSVDPDDVTVLAMADAGVSFAVKGMPVQPGNNFTIGYAGDTPVCAVPAATIFYRATAFDLFLPRLLAGEKISKEQILRMGYGGLAGATTDTNFPDCTFGAGGWL